MELYCKCWIACSDSEPMGVLVSFKVWMLSQWACEFPWNNITRPLVWGSLLLCSWKDLWPANRFRLMILLSCIYFFYYLSRRNLYPLYSFMPLRNIINDDRCGMRLIIGPDAWPIIAQSCYCNESPTLCPRSVTTTWKYAYCGRWLAYQPSMLDPTWTAAL